MDTSSLQSHLTMTLLVPLIAMDSATELSRLSSRIAAAIYTLLLPLSFPAMLTQ